MVSNHGGQPTETLRPTAQALPEVLAEVNGRIPIFVDGGIRRGTDAFKALALGATAVGIGVLCCGVWEHSARRESIGYSKFCRPS